jgi:hypothetical protein
MRGKRMSFRWVLVAAAVAIGALSASNAHAMTPHVDVETGFVYSKIVALHSQKCITQPGGTFGDAILQYICTVSPGSQWRELITEDGYFALVHAATGRCLEVPAFSEQNGANVAIATCNLDYHQQFRTVRAVPLPPPPNGEAAYRIIIRHSGKCLEVAGANTGNGAEIQQNICSLARHRLWHFR